MKSAAPWSYLSRNSLNLRSDDAKQVVIMPLSVEQSRLSLPSLSLEPYCLDQPERSKVPLRHLNGQPMKREVVEQPGHRRSADWHLLHQLAVKEQNMCFGLDESADPVQHDDADSLLAV